jgi:hypothetical protein
MRWGIVFILSISLHLILLGLMWRLIEIPQLTEITQFSVVSRPPSKVSHRRASLAEKKSPAEIPQTPENEKPSAEILGSAPASPPQDFPNSPILQKYLGDLRFAIENEKSQLKNQNLSESDEAKLIVHIEENGRLTIQKWTKPGLSSDFNRGIEQMIQKMGPLKPIPKELRLSTLDVEVPIRYDVKSY